MKKNHIFAIISIVIFIISLFLPAVYIEKTRPISGGTCLLYGWLVSGNRGAWLANPLLFFSWFALLIKHPKVSAFLSFISLCIALNFLNENLITIYEKGSSTEFTVNSYGLGYYFWVTSCFVILAGSLIFLKFKTNTSTEPSE